MNTRIHKPGPITPAITFDSYAIPDPVFAKARPVTVQTPTARPASRDTPAMISTGIIAVLAFLLGVLTTLQFTGWSRAPAAATNPQSGATAAEPPRMTADDLAPAGPGQDVTRAEAPDILAVPARPTAPTRAPAQPGDQQDPLRQSDSGRSQRSALETQVLALIGRNQLRMLREGVLAGAYSVEARKTEDHDRLVLRTVNADLTSQTISTRLRQAALGGTIELPKSLSTSDGDVDIDTMIFDLVQTSLAKDGTSQGAEAAREMSRRAYAASSARTRDEQGERVYVVRPGDSLAYISLQFYGKPDDYIRIFRANSKLLGSPDRIQIGQRLIIPG